MELIILGILAAIMEIVDSSLGMMYGTLLVPILIGIGYNSYIVIPAILISQAIGGIGGSIAHHKFKNADFNGWTRDTKIAMAMIIPGLLVIIFGVLVSVNIPKLYIEIYIALLVIIMSILCLSPLQFTFAWWKQYAIGMLAAFNKALTGGGFGPVTSTGGIVAGLTPRISIATTTMAEVMICMGSFVLYCLMGREINWVFTGSLCIGAIIGGLIGPYISSIISHKILRIIVGILGVISGMWLLWKLFL